MTTDECDDRATLTEAERESIHLLVCGHDELGRTKCPGGSLCCCSDAMTYAVAAVERILRDRLASRAPSGEGEREALARAVRVEYVVGFAFDSYGRVALIRKTRPEWQAGRLNGIGGHVEPGETPDAAMVREFEEETGSRIGGWERFVVMNFPGARIHFYRSTIGTAIMDGLRTTTDETVVKVDYRSLGQAAIIPNLSWLIPLAAYTADTYEPVHVTASVPEAIEHVETGVDQ